jgi:putative endonuclease
MFYFYILRSIKNGRYYIGSCKDIKERLRRHNSGLVKSTKYYSPWELVYNEEYQTLSGARQRECQVKGWKKRSAIKRLIKHF